MAGLLLAAAALGLFLKKRRDFAPPGGSFEGGAADFPACRRPYGESALPELSFQDIKGRRLSFESFRGRPLILNFWASWCAPCLEEFPQLIKAAGLAGGGISLLAVSKDSSKSDISGFLRRMKNLVKWDRENVYIVWDEGGKISAAFHALKTPETFILDRELKIACKKTGAFSLKEAAPLLLRLASQKEP